MHIVVLAMIMQHNELSWNSGQHFCWQS